MKSHVALVLWLAGAIVSNNFPLMYSFQQIDGFSVFFFFFKFCFLLTEILVYLSCYTFQTAFFSLRLFFSCVCDFAILLCSFHGLPVIWSVSWKSICFPRTNVNAHNTVVARHFSFSFFLCEWRKFIYYIFVPKIWYYNTRTV